MRWNDSIKTIVQTTYRLVFTLSCLIVLVFGWQSALLTNSSSAIAAPAGMGDRLEGQIEQATGKVQRELGKLSGQTEGAAKQVKGRTQEEMGRAKSAVDRASSKTETKTKDIVDTVKDFFHS